MSFREYIDHRVAELVEGGEDRPAVVARMADLAGLDPQQVTDFLAGNESECDLDTAEAYGRALELNTDEVLEVAADGTLHGARFYDIGERGDVFGLMRAAPRLGGDGALPEGQNEFIASTSREGRDGDIIDQGTWRLADFRNNPIILNSHIPTEIIGTAPRVGVRGGELRALVAWDMEDPESARIAGQHARGVRSAVSVRWITGRAISRNSLAEDHPAFQARPRQTVWGPQFGRFLRHNTLIEISSVGPAGDAGALQVRGLGPQVGKALRKLNPLAPNGVADIRSALRDPETWKDEQVRQLLAAEFLSLIRSDKTARTALRALVATTPNPPESTHSDALSFIRAATATLRSSE